MKRRTQGPLRRRLGRLRPPARRVLAAVAVAALAIVADVTITPPPPAAAATDPTAAYVWTGLGDATSWYDPQNWALTQCGLGDYYDCTTPGVAPYLGTNGQLPTANSLVWLTDGANVDATAGAGQTAPVGIQILSNGTAGLHSTTTLWPAYVAAYTGTLTVGAPLRGSNDSTSTYYTTLGGTAGLSVGTGFYLTAATSSSVVFDATTTFTGTDELDIVGTDVQTGTEAAQSVTFAGDVSGISTWDVGGGSLTVNLGLSEAKATCNFLAGHAAVAGTSYDAWSASSALWSISSFEGLSTLYGQPVSPNTVAAYQKTPTVNVACNPNAPIAASEPDISSVTRGDSGTKVVWDAPADAGNRVLRGYRVLRKAGSEGSYTVLGTTNASTRTYTESGADKARADTDYSYQVVPVSDLDGSGTSLASDASHLLTGTASSPVASSALDAPTDLVAAAGNADVTLTWTGPTGSPYAVTGYDILRWTDDESTPTSIDTVSGASTLTYHDIAVTRGTTYYYAVAATTSAGDGLSTTTDSNNQDVAVATPGGLDAPTGFAAAGHSRRAVLTWEAPPTVGQFTPVAYRIYSCTSADASTCTTLVDTVTDLSTLSYVVGGLTNGTTYRYAVAGVARVQGGDRVGTLTDVVSVKPSVAAPTDVTAISSSQAVKLSWTPPTSEALDGDVVTGYRIFRGTTATQPGTPIAVVTDDLDEPAYTDLGDLDAGKPKGLVNGKTYSYWIETTTTTDPDVVAGDPGAGAATDATEATPDEGQGLALNLAPEISPVPGADVPIDVTVTNTLGGTLAGPVTVAMTFPESGFTSLPIKSVGFASGSGWSCDESDDGPGVALGTDLRVLTCTNPNDLTPDEVDAAAGRAISSYPKLVVTVSVPKTAAYGSDPINYSVATADMTLTSPSPATLAIGPATSPHLSVSVAPPAQLRTDGGSTSDWQNLTVTVANDGSGDTTGPAVMTMQMPSGVGLKNFSVDSGWSCTVDGSSPPTWRCTTASFLSAGSTAPQLVIPVTGLAKPAGAAPYDFDAKVTSTSIVGSIKAEAHGLAAAPQAAKPLLTPAATPVDAAALPSGTAPVALAGTGVPACSGCITAPLAQSAIVALSVTNAGNATATGQVKLVETVPLRSVVSVADPTGAASAWSCSRNASTVTCVADAQTIAPGGASVAAATVVGPTLIVSPVTSSPMLAAAAFSGSLYSVFGTVSSSPVLVDLSTPAGAVSPPVTTEATLASTPITSKYHSSLTFSLKGNQSSGPSAKQTFVLLAPPQITLDPSSIVVTDAAGTQDPAAADQLVAYPAHSLPTCQYAASGSSSAYPGGATSAIVCVGDTTVPMKSRIDVTVDYTAASSVAGDIVLTTGTVAATGDTASARAASAISLIGSKGVAALAASFQLRTVGKLLAADAGAAQSVAAAVADDAGVLRATKVSLDASATPSIGRPYTYGWVQTSGPTVSWAAPADGDRPGTGGDGNPAFPAKDGLGKAVPAMVAYGVKPTFSAPAVTKRTVLTFQLYVTDGFGIGTATTTVSVDAVPDTAPVLGDITASDESGSPLSLTLDPTPLIGHTVKLTVPYTDTDNDQLSVTGLVLAPTEVSKQPVSKVSDTGTTNGHGTAVLSFKWPSGIYKLQLQVSASDGRLDPAGTAISTKASVTIGEDPTVLGSTVTAADKHGAPITEAVVPSSTVTLSDVLTNADYHELWTKVSWSATASDGAPAGVITPVRGSGTNAQYLTATYRVANTARPGDTVTVRAIATRGSGSSAAVSTATYTITVGAAPTLSVSPIDVTWDNQESHDTPKTGIDGTHYAAVVQGGVAPYTYQWSAVSGPQSSISDTTSYATIDGVRANQVDGDPVTGLATADAPAAPTDGIEQVRVVATDAAGVSAEATVQIASQTPSQQDISCASGAAYAAIFKQAAGLSPTSELVVDLGGVTVDLGRVGTVINGAACSSAPQLQLTNAALTYDGVGLTAIHGTVDAHGITIDSANVSLPSQMGVTGATVQDLAVEFGATLAQTKVTGTLVAHTVPVLKSAGLSGATVTITLAPDHILASGTATLDDSPITLTGSYCLLEGDEVCADVPDVGDVDAGHFTLAVSASDIEVLGGKFSGSGSIDTDGHDSTGSVRFDWDGSGGGLDLGGGATLTAAALVWTPEEFTLQGKATIGDHVAVDVRGGFVDEDHWTILARGGVSQAWNVAPGLTLSPYVAGDPDNGVAESGTSVLGTINRSGEETSYMLGATFAGGWSAGPLSISDAMIGIGSGDEAPAGCALTEDQEAAPYIDVSGKGSIDLGNGSTLGVGAEACVLPGTGWKVVAAVSTPSVTVVKGLDLSGVSLAASHVNSTNATNFTLAGKGTAFGVSGAANVALTKDGAGTAVLAGLTVDLHSLSSVLAGQGSVIYTNRDIADVTQTSAIDLGLPASNSSIPSSCDQATAPSLAGIGIGTGFSVVGQFAMSSDACQFLSGKLGLPKQSTVAVVATLGGSAFSLTAVLNAGPDGVNVFSKDDGTRLDLKSVRLKVSSDGSLGLSGTGRLTTPNAVDSSKPANTMDLTAGLAIKLGAVPSVTIALSKTGNTVDAFGVAGLTLGTLAFQAGVVFTPIPTPSIGVAAQVLNLPDDWAAEMGIQKRNGSTEPMSFALNISASNPIFALDLGMTNGLPFMLPLQPFFPDQAAVYNALSVDHASLVIAPEGGDIGVVHFDPGLSVAFDASILGAGVHVAAAFDPGATGDDPTLSADVQIGAFTAGPISMSDTSLSFATGAGGLDLTFHGAVALGGATAAADLAVSAHDSTGIQLDFNADIANVKLGSVLTLDHMVMVATLAMPYLTKPPTNLVIGAMGQGTVLGTQVTVGGALALGSSGISSFDAIAATSPIHIGSVATISGNGCNADALKVMPAAIAGKFTLPTTGPCLQVGVHPGTSNPFYVKVSGSVAVSGLTAVFDGQLDATGIAINTASVQLTNAVTATVHDSRLYFESVPGSLTGVTAQDPTQGNATVAVHNGDFRMQGALNVTLAGFNGNLQVDLGHLGTSVWAKGVLAVGILSDPSSPIHANVKLAGDFSYNASNGFVWALDGNGALMIGGTQSGSTWTGGYNLAAVAFHIDNGGSFRVAGTLNAGPLTASLSGALTAGSGGVVFDFQANGQIALLGSNVAAAVRLRNNTGSNGAAGAIEASAKVNASVGSLVTIDASAQFLSTGAMCMAGNVNVGSGIAAATATVCTPGVPGQSAGLKATLTALNMITVAVSISSIDDYLVYGEVGMPGFHIGGVDCGWFSCWGAEASLSGKITLSVSSKARDNVVVNNVTIGHVNAGVSLAGQASLWVHACVFFCGSVTIGASVSYNPTQFCAGAIGVNVCYRPPTDFWLS